MQNLPSCNFRRWIDIDELVNFIKFLSDELNLLSYSSPEMSVILIKNCRHGTIINAAER